MIDEPAQPVASAPPDPNGKSEIGPEAEDVIEVDAGDVVWRFDPGFLRSRWTCIYGNGCQGIRPVRAPELGHGCCSLGAEIDGPDEARNIAALASTLAHDRFQFHDLAGESPTAVFADEEMTNTRVVDGACIFLNRPGFAGGAGCALHLGALAHGESPVEWKPSVCWQLPVHVDWEMRDDDVEIATVRAWQRRDWGEDGTTMAWCCTEEPEAYVGDRPVVASMAEELVAIVGEPVYVELRRRLES